MRDARREAFERLGGRYEVRVLEPSPPASAEPPWFADDPCTHGGVPESRLLVSPVPNGDLLWAELARDDAGLAAWCSDRWLGPYRRLGPAPATLVATRLGLHRLAERVVSPARERTNGKIGLRYTHGGFGTPFFGDDVQVRVEGAELVVDDRTGERREAISKLSNAAALVEIELEGSDKSLDVDPAAVRFLADWYGFTTSVLEELRAQAAPELDPARVQLWPEHFDIATELGPEAAGRRAGYGGSPGDELHPEPYLYVLPCEGSAAAGELWQAKGFAGAELAYRELLAAGDQRAAALDFMSERLAALVT